MKYNLPLGVALGLLAALAYSAQTAVVKVEITSLPPLPVVIFIQSLIALLLVLPLILKDGKSNAKALLSTHKIWLHMLRTVFSLSISYLLFYAVTLIPLVNGLLLANTAPLIIPFLGYLFLSQKINHRLWMPLLIGYLGVALALHPDARLFNPGSLLALAAAVGMAASILTVRKIAATDDTKTTLFYFFLFSSLLSGLVSLPFWTSLTLSMLPILFTIGALYFLTQLASTTALKYINAQLAGSLFYSNIIYAAIISLIVWNTLPTEPTVAGIVLIIVGGILCIRVEHKTNLRALTHTR